MTASGPVTAKRPTYRKILDNYLNLDSSHSEDKISIDDAYEAVLMTLPDLHRKRKDSLTPALDSSMFPSKLPINRRAADAKYRDHRRDERFLYGANAVDKWKDIYASLLIRFYWDCIVIDTLPPTSQISSPSSLFTKTLQGSLPGQDLVFPFSDPNTQDLLDWIEDGKLHPKLVSLIQENNLNIYYDGCLMVEIHDFRYCAPSPLPISLVKGGDPSILSPEVHRILLRPNEATLAQDITLILDDQHGVNRWNDDDYLELEESLRLTLTPNLFLDPNPKAGDLIRFVYSQSSGMEMLPYRADPFARAKAVQKHYYLSNKPLSSLSNPSYAHSLNNNHLSYTSRHLQLIDEFKQAKKLSSMEPFPCLDTKKLTNITIAQTTKTLWNIPIQKIYRTIRMDRGPQSRAALNVGPLCFTLNIIATPEGDPEAVIRIGTVWDTAQQGQTIRFKLPSPYIIESYIQSFKALVMIQDNTMKCVTDLTNPSCFPLFSKKP